MEAWVIIVLSGIFLISMAAITLVAKHVMDCTKSQGELKDSIQALRQENNEAMNGLSKDLHTRVSDLRDDLHQDIKPLTTDMAAVKTKLQLEKDNA